LSHYYHVRISERGQKNDEVKNDLDEETLERQFLEPYRNAYPITINGKVIPPDKIERIRVSVSDETSDLIIARLRGEDRVSRALTSGAPSFAWRVADQATDVTEQFITGSPGAEVPAIPNTSQASSARSAPIGPGDKRSIFVVSGRDSEATAALVQMLRAVGPSIIEWEHAVNRVGLPNPYIGDVVFTGLQMADAALVVLTPDDLVRLRPDLLHTDDGEIEQTLQGQARPNVFYEAGIADAYSRQRTVIVEIGPAKSFSDISGRLVVRYDGSPSRRNALVERLRIAGLEPNTSGTDWLSVGDVKQSIDKARQAVTSAREDNNHLKRAK
jgi:predicted nucleotide-binding protein